MKIKTEDIIAIAGSSLTAKESILIRLFAPILLKIAGNVLTKLFPNIAKKLEYVNLNEALEIAKEYDKHFEEDKPKEIEVSKPVIEENKLKLNLFDYNFSKMNIKYFTKEDILEAKEDFTISGEYDWIVMDDKNHKDYKDTKNKKKSTGHYPIVIDENGYVHRGGHSGNTICSSFEKEEYTKNFTGKPRYTGSVRTHYEGTPKGVLGISNFMEVK